MSIAVVDNIVMHQGTKRTSNSSGLAFGIERLLDLSTLESRPQTAFRATSSDPATSPQRANITRTGEAAASTAPPIEYHRSTVTWCEQKASSSVKAVSIEWSDDPVPPISNLHLVERTPIISVPKPMPFQRFTLSSCSGCVAPSQNSCLTRPETLGAAALGSRAFPASAKPARLAAWYGRGEYAGQRHERTVPA